MKQPALIAAALTVWLSGCEQLSQPIVAVAPNAHAATAGKAPTPAIAMLSGMFLPYAR